MLLFSKYSKLIRKQHYSIILSARNQIICRPKEDSVKFQKHSTFCLIMKRGSSMMKCCTKDTVSVMPIKLLRSFLISMISSMKRSPSFSTSISLKGPNQAMKFSECIEMQPWTILKMPTENWPSNTIPETTITRNNPNKNSSKLIRPTTTSRTHRKGRSMMNGCTAKSLQSRLTILLKIFTNTDLNKSLLRSRFSNRYLRKNGAGVWTRWWKTKESGGACQMERLGRNLQSTATITESKQRSSSVQRNGSWTAKLSKSRPRSTFYQQAKENSLEQ